ncbi:hypothetical protein DUNSADRAFT_16232 [Dunaliella salina]|uniref:PIN domain-containing protein n=1 Tax=Dunaliella salina TaxID=3046 RepID=A0ABQ7H145_DUNSA|nr:hypothetical protein DUNSADRAFT_16232 [Dunaliella salina]|eukprot:KAF5840569.1 hypothetical protein DUNSADRAFT_16232 [Dunaliella salina]
MGQRTPSQAHLLHVSPAIHALHLTCHVGTATGCGAAQANHRGVAIPPPPGLNSTRPDSQQQRRHSRQQGTHANGASSSAPTAGAGSNIGRQHGRRDGSNRHGAQQGRLPSHPSAPSSRPPQARPHRPQNSSGHKAKHLSAGGRRQPAFDEGVQGLPNPLVHVELEREGVWKVAAPPGQRFSKAFLAGVEVWASQMMAGQEVRLVHPTFALASQLATPPPPPPPSATPPSGASPSPAAASQLAGSAPSPAAAGSAHAAGAAPGAGRKLEEGGGRVGGMLDGGAAGESEDSGGDSDDSGSATASGDGEWYSDHGSEEGSDEGSEEGSAVSEDEGDAAGQGAEEESCSGSVSSGFSYGALCADDYGDEASAPQQKHHVSPDQPPLTSNRSHAAVHGNASTHVRAPAIPTASAAAWSQGQGSSATASFAFSPPPPPPPGLPHSPAGTPAPQTPQASVVTRGASIVRHSSAADGRVRVSLHLEKQGLTDTEAQLLVAWYKERVEDKLEISKLWLFDNDIGDSGVAALAGLMHDRLQEVHLSHNAMTTKDEALEQQLESRGLHVEIPEVVKAQAGHTHQQNLRWQSIIVGRTYKPSGGKRGGVPSHVRLPWIQSQKQAPSESAVLMAVRSIYQRPKQPALAQARSMPQAMQTAQAAAPPPPVPAQLQPQPLPPSQMSVPPPTQPSATTQDFPPSTAPAPPSPPRPTPVQGGRPGAPLPPRPATDGTSLAPTAPTTNNSNNIITDNASGHFAPGPLLLFPDTSALLSMLGCNVDLPRPPLTLSMLASLAREGRFGRALPPTEQVFVVVADSVMKQLDGLKTLPETRVAVRKFMSEGLEEMGPGGLDFLTVLGAHEGEGLALEAGLMGVAGSKSPLLGNRGAQVDVRIVEVALFFQTEILKGAAPSSAGSHLPTHSTTAAHSLSTSSTGNNGIPSGDIKASGVGDVGTEPVPSLPVLLLTNDNSQLLVAKAHGLPAFRLSNVNTQQLQAIQGSAYVSASMLRSVMGPWATTGLGSVAGTSLQQHFDGSVAALQACRSGLQDALAALSRISSIVFEAERCKGKIDGDSEKEGEAHAEGALQAISAVLNGGGGKQHEPSQRLQQQQQQQQHQQPQLLPECGNTPIISSLSGLMDALRAKLPEFERAVQVQQQPSRVLRWATAP